MDFNHCVLMISARSPFARRVRVALLEHGVPFEIKVFDVFQPQPELIALNPLARVPTVRLGDGSVLVESEKILEAFYKTRPESALLPTTQADQVTVQFWSAMALGVCEKAIEFYLESLRPEVTRDAELLLEIRDGVSRVLERFDHFVAGRNSILPGRVTQADFDMAIALEYLSLRYSSQWESRYTHASDFLRRMGERASLDSTRPPPPV
jgi:glutathione S-transferase